MDAMRGRGTIKSEEMRRKEKKRKEKKRKEKKRKERCVLTLFCKIKLTDKTKKVSFLYHLSFLWK